MGTDLMYVPGSRRARGAIKKPSPLIANSCRLRPN